MPLKDSPRPSDAGVTFDSAAPLAHLGAPHRAIQNQGVPKGRYNRLCINTLRDNLGVLMITARGGNVVVAKKKGS